MGYAIFGMILEKPIDTSNITKRILHRQRRHSIDSAAERENLILEVAFSLVGKQEIELHLPAVDAPVIIHQSVLGTATVHGVKDLNDSDWLVYF